MIFSPLIVFFKSVFSIITQCGSCDVEESRSVIINLVVVVPMSILLMIFLISLVAPIVAILTPYFTIRFIIDNTKSFKKIMNYWSSKNRFKGDVRVKAELFKRRSSSQSYGRRPTLHF